MILRLSKIGMLTQSEFAKLVKSAFEKGGYTKVKVSTAMFAKRADVSARDPKGKKREFKAELVRKWGRTKLKVTPKDDLEWIDELEMLDILFGD